MVVQQVPHQPVVLIKVQAHGRLSPVQAMQVQLRPAVTPV
jgi:hypothetical protein